jgi:beta-glucosidase
MNRQFLDPVFLGRYPEELAEIFGEAWPRWRSSEVEQIRQPIDFLGVNYYTRAVVAQDAACFPLQIGWVLQRQSARTQMGWEVYPPGLTDVLLEVKQRYGDVPLYVTENGAAFYDPPSSESLVDDPLRVRYLQDHIRAAQRARARGVDLKGYFVWSLLDNYEWAHGYSKRFGIVHVDFQTQKRTIKASGRFYAEVIRTQGTVLAGSSKERNQRT